MKKTRINNSISALAVVFFVVAAVSVSCAEDERELAAKPVWESFDFSVKESRKMIGDEFNIDVVLIEGKRDAWYSLSMEVDGEDRMDPDLEGRIFSESEHLSVSCGKLGNGLHVVDMSIKDKMDSAVVHRLSFNVLGRMDY